MLRPSTLYVFQQLQVHKKARCQSNKQKQQHTAHLTLPPPGVTFNFLPSLSALH